MRWVLVIGVLSAAAMLAALYTIIGPVRASPPNPGFLPTGPALGQPPWIGGAVSSTTLSGATSLVPWVVQRPVAASVGVADNSIGNVWVQSAESDGPAGGQPSTVYHVAIYYPGANLELDEWALGANDTPTSVLDGFMSTIQYSGDGSIVSINGTPAYAVGSSVSLDGFNHLTLDSKGLYVSLYGSASLASLEAAAGGLTPTAAMPAN